MLSATGIAAAIAIIAVASNVFEADPTVPGQAGATHVVAADGSGDFSTIQEAVAAAAEGDIVVVRPGRYEGTVTIDRDITLRGDGPRAEIVIAAPAGEADLDTWPEERDLPHALLLDGADVIVTDLTIEVPLNATGIGSLGGSPLIERVTLVNAGPEVPEYDWYNGYYAMWFYGVGEPVVRDSEWDGYVGVREGAGALFEGNTVSSDGISIDGPGASIVRDSVFVDGGWVNSSGATLTVEGNDFSGGNFSADSGSVAEVRDNVFRGFSDSSVLEAAIIVRESDSRATIEDNTVTDASNGVFLLDGASGSIRGNTLEANRIAIQLGPGDGSTVEDNAITSEGVGILIGKGSGAEVTGNDIEVAARGIAISAGSSPNVSDNDVCGGVDSIWVHDNATPEVGPNQVC